jgi:ATP-dependent helicase/nuclease subunit B
MTVRFILGRAGSGKTHHCLEAVRRRLNQDPINGPRLILLVPEQASQQIEGAILRSPGEVTAAHRAEVLSFQRLAHRVLESVGGPVRQALTEPAQAMVLQHLTANLSGSLQYYRRLDRLGGFVSRLGATITELIQEGVTPDELASASTQREDDPVHEAKLHDIRTIYSAYIEYLGRGRLDPHQHLRIARESFDRCEWLHGAEVWVDGFASQSGEEIQTLLALARLSVHTEITMLVDPKLCVGSSATLSNHAAQNLFAKTLKTYQELHGCLADAGLQIEDALVLDGGPRRFQRFASLARLEQSLFMPSPQPAPEAVVEGVELIELPSRRIEVDYAVSRLCQWVQMPNAPYRYRDVAIIVRDLEPYHDLLTEALQSREIPFFIDRRRPMVHHPLVELLRGGAAVAAEAMSMESVRLVLKTGLLDIPIDAADELENYLLAHGLAGFDTWHCPEWSFHRRDSLNKHGEGPATSEADELARINAARRCLLAYLDPWMEFARQAGGHTGAGWTAGILEWLARLNASRILSQWADEAEQDGRLDEAEEHRQVWREIMSFLDDLAFAFSDVTLTIHEFTDALEAGLSGLTLGLVPPTVDQVLVGSIERSRHPDIKAAVVLGFNDGVFPKRPAEDSILNDDDRAALLTAGVRVGAPSRERVLDESLLVYIALTRASEVLVVTYATADDEGKTLRPSPFVDSLLAACPGLTATVVSDPARSRSMWDLLCTSDLRRRLTMEFRSRPPLAMDETESDPSDEPTEEGGSRPVSRGTTPSAARGRWNELYDGVRESLSLDAVSLRALASLGEREDARISPATIERLFAGPLRTSVSQLETYAACPFQYFVKHVLRLRERVEATVKPVDIGKIHHGILEDFIDVLSSRGKGLDQLSDGDILGGLRESCERVATRLPEGGVLYNARDAYLYRRSARHLARVIQAQRRVASSGSARPRRVELPFGFDDLGGLPALELSTPAGRRVLVRGFIDRVDLAELGDDLLGVVIDYKDTRNKRLDMSKVFHGLSLQLLAYLLVLAERGQSLVARPIQPIGALFVSLASKYQKVDHPDDQEESREAALEGSFRPRGILLADKFHALDRTFDGGRSAEYNFFRKKDGAIGYVESTDATAGADFLNTLAHTRAKLSELSDRVLDGDVAVRPYRLGTFSPCTWCPMTGVCRFEMGVCDVQFLDSLKRSEVFIRLAEGTRP